MKTSSRLLAAALTLGVLAPGLRAALTDGMTEGKPALQSMRQLAFGPEGILFVADAKAAALVAIATGDTKSAPDGATIKIEGVNQKIAALLGTEAAQIIINDLAVNPSPARPTSPSPAAPAPTPCPSSCA